MLRHLKPAYPEGITTNRFTNSVCAALAISQSNRWWVMLSILFPQITSALDLLCTPSIPATRQLHLRARMASNHLCHPNWNTVTSSTIISAFLALLWNVASGDFAWLFGLIMNRLPSNTKLQMHCSNDIARCILGNPSQLVQVAWWQNELAGELSSNESFRIIDQIVRATLSLVFNFASMFLFHHSQPNLSRFGFM